MKNIRKKFSALLTVLPMMAGGLSHVAAETKDVVVDRAAGSVNTNSKSNALSLMDDFLEKAAKTVNYQSETLSQKEVDDRSAILKRMLERSSHIREDAMSLLTEMTSGEYNRVNSPDFTEMQSSIEKVKKEADDCLQNFPAVNSALTSGQRERVDELINSLDRKIKKSSDFVKDTKGRSWPDLKETLLGYQKRLDETNKLERRSLLQTCQAICNRAKTKLNNLSRSLRRVQNNALSLTTSYISSELESALSEINRLDSSLVNADDLDVHALTAMRETAGAIEGKADSLVEQFGNMQTRANTEGYASVLYNLQSRVDAANKSCHQRTQMNLQRRVMSGAQRTSLIQVKEELKKLFDHVNAELDSVRKAATQSKSLSKSMPRDERVKLESLVNDMFAEMTDHMMNWNRTIAAIENDDELRAQWNPEEMQRIMMNRLRKKCYDILSNKQWNNIKKTEGIVNEINNVQPGTGTILEPVVSGILNYLKTGTPLTSLGEAVRNNLSGRSWFFTGEGGTGKSTAAELLAAAFNVKLIEIKGAALRSPGEVGRILRDIRALTQPQTNQRNIVNFMVLLDEVDTGVCVATDSRGRSLEFEENYNAAPGAAGYGEENAAPAGSYADEDAAPLAGRTRVGKATRWKLKTKSHTVENADIRKNKRSMMDTVMTRSPEGFRGLSAIFNLLDSNTQSNMFGLFSTSNFSRQSMPEEVARRLSPDSHEITFRRPTKSEFAQIIAKKLPNLSFSDGYDRLEGALKIAEMAEKQGLSAAGLLSTITPIANAVRSAEDTGCQLPASGICKLISKSMTEAQVIDEARKLNFEDRKTLISDQEKETKSAGDSSLSTYDSEYDGTDGSFAPGVRLAPPVD